MTSVSKKCPNCGCEKLKTMVFLTVCYHCDLEVSLWSKWRDMQEESAFLRLEIATLKRHIKDKSLGQEEVQS